MRLSDRLRVSLIIDIRKGKVFYLRRMQRHYKLYGETLEGSFINLAHALLACWYKRLYWFCVWNAGVRKDWNGR